MLEQVKNALGITGTYQDNTIQTYIDEVVSFLVNGGVNQSVIELNPGIVARGVADLWNYGSGSANLSPYFIQRASQLALGNVNTSVGSTSITDRLSSLEATTTDHEIRITNVENKNTEQDEKLDQHEKYFTALIEGEVDENE